MLWYMFDIIIIQFFCPALTHFEHWQYLYKTKRVVMDDHKTKLKNLGSFLSELRKQYGVTISQASADMGIARNTLGSAERGVLGLSLMSMDKIAYYYGITVSELIISFDDT